MPNQKMIAERIKDWEAGLSDNELAEKWGISNKAVRIYRNKRRWLREGRGGGNELPEEEAKAREQDWLNGLDDEEMAAKWFITILAVQAYRRKRGWMRGPRGGYRRRKNKEAKT